MTGLAFAVALVLVALIADHFLHSYLRLRERERLSATDKAVLEKRFEGYDDKLRVLKDSVTNIRSR